MFLNVSKLCLFKNETVESMQGYLMKSLKSEFAEMHTLNKRRIIYPSLLYLINNDLIREHL